MAISDPYAGHSNVRSAYGKKSKAITPGNNDLATVPKGIVLLTDGDVTVIPQGNADNETVSFVALSAGYVIPFMVRRVTAATATVATIED